METKRKKTEITFVVLPMEIVIEILSWYISTSKEFFNVFCLSKKIQKTLITYKNITNTLFFEIKIHQQFKWKHFHHITQNIPFLKCLIINFDKNHGNYHDGVNNDGLKYIINSILASNTQLEQFIFNCNDGHFNIDQIAMEFMVNLKYIDYTNGFNCMTVPNDIEVLYVRFYNGWVGHCHELKEFYCTSGDVEFSYLPKQTKIFIPKDPKTRTYMNRKSESFLTFNRGKKYWMEIKREPSEFQ